MNSDYSLYYLLYAVHKSTGLPDTYEKINHLFNSYPEEVLYFLRYICRSVYDVRGAAAIKFLIDKGLATQQEIYITRENINDPAYRLVYFYSLYKSGKLTDVEEIKKCINDLDIHKYIELEKIIFDSVDSAIQNIIVCYLERNLATKTCQAILSCFIDDVYEYFRDKIKKLVVNNFDQFFYEAVSILYSMAQSKNPDCLNDLICLYHETHDAFLKTTILKVMSSCVSLETARFFEIISKENEHCSMALNSLTDIYRTVIL
ncbi:MAG: hypothetical protein NZM04_05450 [Methylacidiphilales bacterium]|nr:hypothetical protein [Candidatus Methylacidiphilales bacterium]